MADVTRTLARLRVPLGFAFAVLVILLARPTGMTLAIGSSIAVAGEALRIWAAGHLNKSREVTQSGPYRYVAHPLYVGSSVMGLGLSLAAGSPWVFVLVVLYLGSTITAAIKSEEAFLRQKFGSQYESYRRGDAAHDAAASTRRFSMAQATANHEYRAMLGLVLAVLLLSLKAAYNAALWPAAGTP